MEGTAERLKRDFATMLHYWPLLIGGASVLSITIVTLIGWWALPRCCRASSAPMHKLSRPPTPGRWRLCRRGCMTFASAIRKADHDALGPVSLSVEPGEHLAVTGANGSGKTTLMLVLAGREPTRTVERPVRGGARTAGRHRRDHAAPGKPGARRAWPTTSSGGCHPAEHRCAPATGRGGLDGLAERDTGGLSGGELQRLAVAAALAREPSLLIADEITSMVDQQGRDALMDVLSGLTRHHRMSLVHITHYNDEADAADRAVNLTAGGGAADNTAMVETARGARLHGRDGPPQRRAGARARRRQPRYGSGTPWATTALRDINFVVCTRVTAC